MARRVRPQAQRRFLRHLRFGHGAQGVGPSPTPESGPDHASERAWPIRFVDLDVLGHVNNAAQWAPVEEVAHRTGMELEGVRAQLEHGGETPPGSATIRWVGDASGFRTWLTTEAGTGSAAEVRPL